MKAFLIRWVVTTIAVFTASLVVPGISYSSLTALLGASLLLGLCNAFLKPLLMLLSLPFLILTFGLFTLVINSFLLLLVGKIVNGFSVAGWGSAFFGALIISLVTVLMKSFQSPPEIKVETHSQKFKPPDKVIDV